ncbi:hypothetical protein M436DRAFT_81617 [Aureobasidium namibiae CBS 147.97]|uniref:Uncharacterized protein n=1 Tax=Aureobasidium namibiae CBS 147.97 TaxID=1043004 RepID=A0A074WJB8_9PEZI
MTGDGPNTFVTDGITITSPSVAISFASVSRVDGCFTTLESTIIVVSASEVMSARSARALYDHKPFRYQDLNYKCQPANSSTSWIQDEPGDDCFQQVPAAAYFVGESAFAWDEYYPTAYTRALTIGDDYRPYILLPSTMTEWANSVFHTTSCEIQVNGIWDPPRALIPGTTVATPVVAWSTPPAAAASSTVSAVPAEADHTQLPETSTSQIPATSTALADNLGSEFSSSNEPSAVTNTVTPESPVAAPSQDSQYHSAGGMQPSASASSSMHEESSQPEPNASTNVMDTSIQDSQYLSADAGQFSTPASSSVQNESSRVPTMDASKHILSTSTQDSQYLSESAGQTSIPGSVITPEESSQWPNSDASASSTSTSADPYTAAINTVATPSHPSGSSPATTVVAYQGRAAAVETSIGGLLIGLLCYTLLT